jgi:hypothetical protein
VHRATQSLAPSYTDGRDAGRFPLWAATSGRETCLQPLTRPAGARRCAGRRRLDRAGPCPRPQPDLAEPPDPAGSLGSARHRALRRSGPGAGVVGLRVGRSVARW